MKVTSERIPESRVLLKVEIPPEQVEKAIEKTYRDISRRIRIPGFRPGRAPRPLVERYVGGAETVQREGVDRLIEESFRQALRESNILPIGEADISERPEFHPGEPLVFEATVPVAPTVELGDYQSIHMEPVAVEATPEQVNRFIDDLRESKAEWTPVERGIQDHDHAVIDVLGVAGTVPTLFGPGGETLLQTEGGREVYKVEGHEHEVNTQGPPEFAPGFDEELLGLEPESEKRFGLTLPVDFADPDLANQSVVFHVKVHEVKEKHLPELNEEFAKEFGAESMEQLRDTVRQRLQVRLEQEAYALFESALVDAVIERSTIEIPDVMIERQVDLELSDMKADIARQQVSWPDFLLLTKKSDEDVRAELREPALRTLRGYLVLREVSRQEGLRVMPEDVDAEIEATAAQFGTAAKAIRERLSTRDQRERIESRLFYQKALKRLTEIAQQPREGTETAAEPTPATESAAETPASEHASIAEGASPGPGEPTTETSPSAGTNEETTTNG